jgi:hypothetical protein
MVRFCEWLWRVAATLMVALATPLFAETPVTLPGVSWSIVPPPGFAKMSDGKAGMLGPGGVILTMQQFPASPPELEGREMMGQVVGPPGDRRRLDSYEDVTLGTARGVMLTGQMIDRKLSMHVLTVSGTNSTLYAAFLIPDAASALIDPADLRAALLSVSENTDAGPTEMLADFPVILGELAGLHPTTVIVNRAVNLTDGPGDDMATDLAQLFAVIVIVPGDPADFDPDRDAWPLAYKIQEERPGTEILSARAEDGPGGRQITVIYRQKAQPGIKVRSMAMMRAVGPKMMVMMIAQAPDADRFAANTFRAIFDGIAPR